VSWYPRNPLLRFRTHVRYLLFPIILGIEKSGPNAGSHLAEQDGGISGSWTILAATVLEIDSWRLNGFQEIGYWLLLCCRCMLGG
jgi:hypothetical protein